MVGTPERGSRGAMIGRIRIDPSQGDQMANDDPVAMTPVAAVVRHVEWLEFALAAARDEEARRRERLGRATDKNREKRTVRLAEVTAEVRELGALVQGPEEPPGSSCGGVPSDRHRGGARRRPGSRHGRRRPRRAYGRRPLPPLHRRRRPRLDPPPSPDRRRPPSRGRRPRPSRRQRRPPSRERQRRPSRRRRGPRSRRRPRRSRATARTTKRAPRRRGPGRRRVLIDR